MLLKISAVTVAFFSAIFGLKSRFDFLIPRPTPSPG